MNRRKYWIDTLKLDSSKGRKEELAFSETHQPPAFYEIKNKLRKKLCTEPTFEQVKAECERKGIKLQSGTSIFDACLCEIMYRWFNVEEGSILDPFAGGSVRGVMAAALGYEYFGNDLRKEQIEENIAQAKEAFQNNDNVLFPIWTIGDSTKIDTILKNAGKDDKMFDLIFSCPPYADLEVYSDNPKDLSNMEYPDFIKGYNLVIKKCCQKLKTNRFAVFVVSEVRDKKGFYRGFVRDTIKAFEDAGLHFYNDLVLLNSVGGSAITVRGMFAKNRKCARTHQNILIFYKGEVSNIRENYKEKTIPQPSWDFITNYVKQNKNV